MSHLFIKYQLSILAAWKIALDDDDDDDCLRMSIHPSIYSSYVFTEAYV